MRILTVYTSFPSQKEAEKIAQTLLKENLATCINMFQIKSIYEWKDKIKKGKEIGAFIKTAEKVYKKLIKRLKELHPYEVPMIIVYDIKEVLKEYKDWVLNNIEKRS